MNAKREFAAVPDFLQNMAEKTPGGQALSAAAPEPKEKTEVEVYGQPVFRERPAFQKMSVNMPKDLYEELRAYMKITDVSMSDVVINGARRELKRLKDRD
jgi:hypothetical protein